MVRFSELYVGNIRINGITSNTLISEIRRLVANHISRPVQHISYKYNRHGNATILEEGDGYTMEYYGFDSDIPIQLQYLVVQLSAPGTFNDERKSDTMYSFEQRVIEPGAIEPLRINEPITDNRGYALFRGIIGGIMNGSGGTLAGATIGVGFGIILPLLIIIGSVLENVAPNHDDLVSLLQNPSFDPLEEYNKNSELIISALGCVGAAIGTYEGAVSGFKEQYACAIQARRQPSHLKKNIMLAFLAMMAIFFLNQISNMLGNKRKQKQYDSIKSILSKPDIYIKKLLTIMPMYKIYEKFIDDNKVSAHDFLSELMKSVSKDEYNKLKSLFSSDKVGMEYEKVNEMIFHIPYQHSPMWVKGLINHPKSKKTCLKRNMKWNSNTKRCNKSAKKRHF